MFAAPQSREQPHPSFDASTNRRRCRRRGVLPLVQRRRRRRAIRRVRRVVGAGGDGRAQVLRGSGDEFGHLENGDSNFATVLTRATTSDRFNALACMCSGSNSTFSAVPRPNTCNLPCSLHF